MSKPLSPRFLRIGYATAAIVLGIHALWLVSMVILFQLIQAGVIETHLLHASDTQSSIATQPAIMLFGYVYVGAVILSFVAVLIRKKWAFWTYLTALLGHAGIWVALTDNPFVLSYVTLAMLVVESGVLLLIQLLVNARKLR